MHDFWLTISFSLLSIGTCICFAFIAPPFGASLILRNEALVSIALPSVGSAIIGGAVLCGVPHTSNTLLYSITAVALFGIMLALPLQISKQRSSIRRRELILAALFCIGQTMTMLFMSISPLAEARFKHLLEGELLAVGTNEFIVTALITGILIVLGVLRRGGLYAFSLDEEGLHIREKSYKQITLLYRAVATIIITGGIVLIGPLLTTSFLIVPAFFMESRSRGIDSYMVHTSVCGVLSVIGGFLLAIVLDLPPAPIIISVLVCIGLFYLYLPSRILIH